MSPILDELSIPAVATREFVMTCLGAVAGPMSDCTTVDAFDLNTVDNRLFGLAASPSVTHFLQTHCQHKALWQERLYAYRHNYRT